VKIIWCLILIVFIVAVTYMAAHAEVLWQDSSGMVIEVREELGPVWEDTCTVVQLINGNYYLSHKYNFTEILAEHNHTVKRIK
jgi:hypothetical protein